MRIDVLTLFPEMFSGAMNASMLGRAQANGLLELHTHNIRDYADNKHKKTDDYPFGGGASMSPAIMESMKAFSMRASAIIC